MLDARVEGAVGGNAFRGFAMSVIYPNATTYFSCVVGCRPSIRALMPHTATAALIAGCGA